MCSYGSMEKNIIEQQSQAHSDMGHIINKKCSANLLVKAKLILGYAHLRRHPDSLGDANNVGSVS